MVFLAERPKKRSPQKAWSLVSCAAGQRRAGSALSSADALIHSNRLLFCADKIDRPTYITFGWRLNGKSLLVVDRLRQVFRTGNRFPVSPLAKAYSNAFLEGFDEALRRV